MDTVVSFDMEVKVLFENFQRGNCLCFGKYLDELLGLKGET